MDCIFCKIVAGDIPAYKVYEDDQVLAFLDIAPVNYGHTLVIPKEHFANLEEIPEDKLAAVIAGVKKVGQTLKQGLGVAGYNVQINNDPVAGQVVPHLHFHVIPRQAGDGLKLWPQGKYADGEAEEVIERIKKGLR
jgi:histidine triad (HIT) family protein